MIQLAIAVPLLLVLSLDIQYEVVAAQGTKCRAPNRVRDGGFLGSESMSEKQLYPVYDRLVSKDGRKRKDYATTGMLGTIGVATC